MGRNPSNSTRQRPGGRAGLASSRTAREERSGESQVRAGGQGSGAAGVGKSCPHWGRQLQAGFEESLVESMHTITLLCAAVFSNEFSVHTMSSSSFPKAQI